MLSRLQGRSKACLGWLCLHSHRASLANLPSTACRAAEILNEAMAADQRAQLQNYTHQLGQRDSEFAAMRQRMDDLRYFHIAGCDWRIKQETMYTFKAASWKLVCCHPTLHAVCCRWRHGWPCC